MTLVVRAEVSLVEGASRGALTQLVRLGLRGGAVAAEVSNSSKCERMEPLSMSTILPMK